MQRSAFLLHIYLDHLFGIIPAAAGISHENRLEQAKHGDRDQVSNEQSYCFCTSFWRCQAGKGHGKRKEGDKDVKHPVLRVLGADPHHFFGIFDRSLLTGILIQLDILLDILYRSVSPGSHRLNGSAGEPVDYRAPADKSDDRVGIEQSQDGFRLDL